MPHDDFSKYLTKRSIEDVLDYIESYWPNLIKKNTEDVRSLIGLPHSYIVPAQGEIFQEQYYWDSYVVVRALIDHPKYFEIAIGMVENLLYMVERFGIVPNASRFYFLTRSQQPLLSSMVSVVFEKTKDKKWLRRACRLLEDEYNNVWMGKIYLRNYRLSWTGLSRYYDINALHDLAEAESGWDMTSRFDHRCMDFCPVDLNCLLYIYEKDLEEAFRIFGKDKKAKIYQNASKRRAELINKYLWSQKEGYFFDYDFENKRRSALVTVAGIYPLNVGLASPKQAKSVISIMEHELLKDWGIVQSVPFVHNLQWDYPNGWAPLQLRTIEAMLRYGYVRLAKRLITKWLAVNIKVFKETGELWEKYDVVHGRIGEPDRYPTVPGFAWTNATFLILYRLLGQIEKAPEGATPIFMVRRLGWF